MLNIAKDSKQGNGFYEGKRKPSSIVNGPLLSTDDNDQYERICG